MSSSTNTAPLPPRPKTPEQTPLQLLRVAISNCARELAHDTNKRDEELSSKPSLARRLSDKIYKKEKEEMEKREKEKTEEKKEKIKKAIATYDEGFKDLRRTFVYVGTPEDVKNAFEQLALVEREIGSAKIQFKELYHEDL